MSQNTSSAVMAQRAPAPDALDYFPTPPWATRALVEWIEERLPVWPREQTVLEPAAGGGHMARALAERFLEVHAADVHDHGFPLDRIEDFTSPLFSPRPVDWVITNPPFLLAESFAQRAVALARTGAALLVRTAFLEGAGRHARLFSVMPPSHVLQFAERVPMLRGRCLRGASTATAYAWLVWHKGSPPGTRFGWIAPCRARLERWGDYDDDLADGRADLLGEGGG